MAKVIQGGSRISWTLNIFQGASSRDTGHRLHVLFHICGKYVEHRPAFLRFLQTGTVSCGGLREALLADFENKTAQMQMHVLGLFGKLYSGPWMKKFYTSAESGISHIDGIRLVKKVIVTLTEQTQDPASVFTLTSDFLGNAFDAEDSTLQALLQPPADMETFQMLMKAVIMACVEVLERQYKRYFLLLLSWPWAC